MWPFKSELILIKISQINKQKVDNTRLTDRKYIDDIEDVQIEIFIPYNWQLRQPSNLIIRLSVKAPLTRIKSTNRAILRTATPQTHSVKVPEPTTIPSLEEEGEDFQTFNDIFKDIFMRCIKHAMLSCSLSDR